MIPLHKVFKIDQLTEAENRMVAPRRLEMESCAVGRQL